MKDISLAQGRRSFGPARTPFEDVIDPGPDEPHAVQRTIVFESEGGAYTLPQQHVSHRQGWYLVGGWLVIVILLLGILIGAGGAAMFLLHGIK